MIRYFSDFQYSVSISVKYVRWNAVRSNLYYQNWVKCLPICYIKSEIRYLIRWHLLLERLCELFSKFINTGAVDQSLELLQILINEQLRVSIKSKDEVRFTISVYILSKKLSAATIPYLFEVDPETVTIRQLKLMVSFIFTHFNPMFHFYIPWKHQKTRGFLLFSGSIEMDQWANMG